MIYFIQRRHRDLIKIGYTKSVPSRLQQIRSQYLPEPVRLLATMRGGYAVEDALHKRFHADLYPGEFEWFRPTAALHELIAEHCARGQVRHQHRVGE